MYSVIICAFREETTIARAVKPFEGADEIIVVAPDKETLRAARNAGAKTLQDGGRGKPEALNLAVRKAKGDILVLSDGDVWTEDHARLLEYFDDKRIGAVTGRPVSSESRETMLGYWSHLLTQAAHSERRKGGAIDCSGYLYAVRRSLMPVIPKESLVDDAYVSQFITKKGFTIAYEPRAKAFVRYPATFSDWLKQKRRSAGGYVQLKEMGFPSKFRSFWKEAKGIGFVFGFCRSIKECTWSTLLLIARLYLWLIIFRDVKLLKRSSGKIWLRVDSTKGR